MSSGLNDDLIQAENILRNLDKKYNNIITSEHIMNIVGSLMELFFKKNGIKYSSLEEIPMKSINDCMKWLHKKN